MTVYAVRKRHGHWTVCSAETVAMLFESYEEALEIARTAAATMAGCSQSRAVEHREAGHSGLRWPALLSDHPKEPHLRPGPSIVHGGAMPYTT